MPDLTHRPTRYVTALVASAALAFGAVTHYEVGTGDRGALMALRAENAALQLQADRLREQSATSTRAVQADLRLAARGSSATVQQPTVPVVVMPVRSSAAPGTALGGVPGGGGAGGGTGARPGGGAGDCARYPNQEAAQAVFERARTRLAAMDGDGDGRACEQLRSARPPAPVRIVVRTTVPAPAPTRHPDARPTPSPAPTAGPVPTATPALPATPSKAEILASGKHFGLATATEEEFSRIEGTLGRQASMEGFFKGFDTGYDRKRVIASWTQGRIPLMTWESRPLTDPHDPTDYSLSRIISGAFDDYLITYARDVKRLGLPVIVRLNHEMNGNWNRWSEFESRNGTKKGEYVAAWRHVHDVFAAQGANEHVIWLWSPNRIDNIPRYAPISEYWPGSAYVDQVGMTGYLRQEDRPPFTFSGTYDKTLAQLRALAPDKPLVLSEVGATEDRGRKVDWLRTFFPGLVANPDIAGFVWFNYAISDGRRTDDWRLNSTLPAFGEFKSGLASIGYGLDVGKRLTLQPRAGAVATASPVPTAPPGPTAPPTAPVPQLATTTTATTPSPTPAPGPPPSPAPLVALRTAPATPASGAAAPKEAAPPTAAGTVTAPPPAAPPSAPTAGAGDDAVAEPSHGSGR